MNQHSRRVGIPSAFISWTLRMASTGLVLVLASCGGGDGTATGTDGTGNGNGDTVILPPIRANGVISGFAIAQDTIAPAPEPDNGNVIEPEGGEFGGDVGEDGDGDGTGGDTGDGSVSRENLRPPAPAPSTYIGCRYRGLEALQRYPDNVRVGRGTSRDGGIGIGGAPGKFKGVAIVVRYPDGTEVGQAIVDDASGMVTVYPGVDYTGGLEITAYGGDGASYYDPGSKREESFPAGYVMRAYVSSIRGNIALSPFTDAAAGLVEDFKSRVNGQISPAWLKSQYSRANREVNTLINGCLPGAFRIRDMTKLPDRVLDSATNMAVLADDQGGRHIAGLTAFQQMAQQIILPLIRPRSPSGEVRPMFRLASHLLLDLVDDDSPAYLDGGVTPPDPDGNRPNQQPTLPPDIKTAYPVSRFALYASLRSEINSAWAAYGPPNAPAIAQVSVQLTCKVTLTDGSAGADMVRTFGYDPQGDRMSGISGGVVSINTVSEHSESTLGDLNRSRANFVPYAPLSSGEFVSVKEVSYGEDGTKFFPPLNRVSYRVVARRGKDYRPTYFFKRRTVYPVGDINNPAIDETFECSPG